MRFHILYTTLFILSGCSLFLTPEASPDGSISGGTIVDNTIAFGHEVQYALFKHSNISETPTTVLKSKTVRLYKSNEPTIIFKTTTTNENGEFTFHNLPFDTYTLLFYDSLTNNSDSMQLYGALHKDIVLSETESNKNIGNLSIYPTKPITLSTDLLEAESIHFYSEVIEAQNSTLIFNAIQYPQAEAANEVHRQQLIIHTKNSENAIIESQIIIDLYSEIKPTINVENSSICNMIAKEEITNPGIDSILMYAQSSTGTTYLITGIKGNSVNFFIKSGNSFFSKPVSFIDTTQPLYTLSYTHNDSIYRFTLPQKNTYTTPAYLEATSIQSSETLLSKEELSPVTARDFSGNTFLKSTRIKFFSSNEWNNWMFIFEAPELESTYNLVYGQPQALTLYRTEKILDNTITTDTTRISSSSYSITLRDTLYTLNFTREYLQSSDKVINHNANLVFANTNTKLNPAELTQSRAEYIGLSCYERLWMEQR